MWGNLVVHRIEGISSGATFTQEVPLGGISSVTHSLDAPAVPLSLSLSLSLSDH